MDFPMKQLTLVRHAKSSWKNPGLDDFDRPLNNRGRHDLPGMAQRVYEAGLRPDRLLSSTALRALTTAKTLATELQLSSKRFVVLPALYAASCRSLLRLLQEQSDQWHHLMLVGHNPGLEELGYYLTREALPKFPTAAVLHLHLKIEHWSDLDESCGCVQFFDYPKLHQK